MSEMTIVPEPVQKQMDHNFCHIPKFITLLVTLVFLSYISVAHRTIHYLSIEISLALSHTLSFSFSLCSSFDTRRTSLLVIGISQLHICLLQNNSLGTYPLEFHSLSLTLSVSFSLSFSFNRYPQNFMSHCLYYKKNNFRESEKLLQLSCSCSKLYLTRAGNG